MTHKCQPLNVLVFSAVKHGWQSACADYAAKGMLINRFTVIPAYVHATRHMMTPNLIAKAFEKTGIYPVNRSVFMLEDFRPSKASLMIAYVPDTFPDAFPSSDPAEYSDTESIQDSGSQDDGDSTFTIHDELDGLDNGDNDSNRSGTESDSMDTNPAHPTSGLMTALMQIDSQVLHRTCSVTFKLAVSGKSHIASLTASSLEEDSALSHEDVLRELHTVWLQLRGVYQDLGDSVSQLGTANAHCTSAQRELRFVRRQLDSTRKKRE
jgi:hypothetical protein